MSIELTWHNQEKTILHHNYNGFWSLEDLHMMIDDTYKWIDSVEHSGTVDIIADMRESRTPPNKLLSAMRHYRNKRHDRQGIQVIVGSSIRLSFMKIITQASMAILPQARNVRFASSIEDAQDLIKTYHMQDSAV